MNFFGRDKKLKIKKTCIIQKYKLYRTNSLNIKIIYCIVRLLNQFLICLVQPETIFCPEGNIAGLKVSKAFCICFN